MTELLIDESRVNSFEKYLRETEKSENTVIKYVRDIRTFTAFSGGTVTKKTVSEYRSWLAGQGFAPRSINSMLASLNCMLTFFGMGDYRAKAVRLQQPVYCREERELGKAEYLRLLDTAAKRGKERLSLILQTICATGIRVSELAYITAEAARRGEATVTLKGKTRTVFIVKKLQKKLLEYMRKNKITTGQVFVTRSGRSVSRTNIWREMKNLCRAAEVEPEKVFPHNLRHLFARLFYSIDKDIAKLADVLGHSSINTTRIYIISTGSEHRRRMENMHLVM